MKDHERIKKVLDTMVSHGYFFPCHLFVVKLNTLSERGTTCSVAQNKVHDRKVLVTNLHCMIDYWLELHFRLTLECGRVILSTALSPLKALFLLKMPFAKICHVQDTE